MRASRSILAVPASNLEMAGKALASAADSVFLDLEDAVAPGEKAGARKKIVQALQEFDWRGRPTLYRANALDTPTSPPPSSPRSNSPSASSPAR